MKTLVAAFGLVVLVGFNPRPGFAASIVVSDFESGTLSGWTFSGQGNAIVLNDLSGITPIFGAWFAMLSNGPGDQGGTFDEAQLLSDPFLMTPGDTLSLAIRRLTSEFTGSLADPGRLDGFSAQLIPVLPGAPIDLHGSTVADPAFGPIAGAPIAAPGGDTFFEYTDWLVLTASGLSGSYRLALGVLDAGDSSFDSALLVDGELSPSQNVIPEPSTGFLLALGMVVIAISVKSTN